MSSRPLGNVHMTHCALAQGQVQCVARKLLLQVRYRRNRLREISTEALCGMLCSAHPAFTDPQRLDLPLVPHRVFQSVEPRVAQVTQPPVSRMVDSDL